MGFCLESETSGALTHNAQAPCVSEPSDQCAEQEQGNEEKPGSGDQPLDVSSSSGSGHTDESGEMVITSIRATDVALGLRRVPAGFYTVVHHSSLEWRTENRRSSVNNDVVKWGGPIPIPSDLSATICLEVYASFEFQPMLGNGEELRTLTITVEQLLDRSAKIVPFTFLPKDGDIVSPCSSILVTVKRRQGEKSDSSVSRVLGPRCSTTESLGQLEEATNQGHTALSRYRKHRERPDLEHSIEQFEDALNICSPDHPCRATAQSNLAMARFILCQVDGMDASLEIPLHLYRDALAARPAGHLDRPSTLIQLASVLFARLEKWRDGVEVAQAQALLQEAMELSSAESHENRAATFVLQMHAGRKMGPVQADDQLLVEQDATSQSTDGDPWILSQRLLDRFEQFGNLADLQQAITVVEELVRSTPVLDDRYRAGLANLGVALSYRFDHLGELGDLEEAISRYRDAIDLTPHGHPDKPGFLNNLGDFLRTRFQRLGELSDLQEAISRHKNAVDLIPHGHPDKPTCLNNLGNSFFLRFRRLGEPRDLEEAISRYRDAVGLTPPGHPDGPAHLNSLGNSVRARFERLGDLSDLEEAILKHRDAVDLTPHGHPDKARRLNNLGVSFLTRFDRLGELSDLEEAISTHKDAVDLTPHGHPEKLARLNNLGNSFFTRFQRLGELSDLEEAISRQRNAVDLTPHDHPVKPSRLNNLGNSFVTRFERLGELNDLEKAISTHRDAVDLTPPGHADKPGHLHNLSNSFFIRFEHLGELSDLEEAISRQRNAVDLTPPGHPGRPHRLNNLGNFLRARFERLGELSDLEGAISTHKNAVDLTPHGHPDRPRHLTNLGNSFRDHFERLEDPNDLEEAISRHKDAVDLTPHGHPDKPAHLNNLGSSLVARFERLGELSDLEEAISKYKDAVDLTPPGHPDKLRRLNNLGNSFVARFGHFRDLSDLEQAISLYSHVASASIGPVTVRFRASQKWILCARSIRHHSLLHAYSVAIGLLPQLAWIGLSLTDRYRELMQGADVVREAAAAALDSGLPETAVEWLEQGRSIVWGELFQLRSSYEELSSAHPDHARRLRELSVALEHAGASREKSQSAEHQARMTGNLQQEADMHRTRAIERDKLLQEIRRLPGFERFLLHKEFSQLHASAHAGPVVILNAAESRCDALVVLADVVRVIHVPLPNFTFERSAGLRNMLKKLLGDARAILCDDSERAGKRATRGGFSWESLLSTLWNGVVKPVLDALAFSSPGDLSRVFWCPTGPFVFLPIHAAGFYGTQYLQPQHKVSDFVVSSYVPTLSILARPSPKSDAASSGDLRLLAVRQPPSDGLSRLPGVNTEVGHIRAVIKNSPLARTTLVESSVGTVEEVLTLMKEADWVHFACHGIQDTASPTESGLCLADRRRLKISDIIALSRPHDGGLAFLSACETATGDEGLSDEAIHIVAGMLFAGYGGVVGTMWSISDGLAPRVARDVYEQLFGNGTKPNCREAARALHDAIGRLRDRHASFVEWLPFIHVGL